MQYVSTRGDGATVGFADACLAGLAPDGGLFTPSEFPQIEKARPGANFESLVHRVYGTTR